MEIEHADVGRGEDRNRWRGRGGWVASAVTHVLVLGLLALAITAPLPQPKDAPPTRTSPPIPPPPKVVTDPKRDIKPESTDPQRVEEMVEQPQPLATDPDLELQSLVDPLEVTDQVATPTAEANPNPAAATGSNAFNFATTGIGGGGSPPGGYGPRGKPRGPHKGRPPGPQVERSTKAALRWFARHQSPDGHWDVDDYQNNCRDGALRCEPGAGHTGAEGDIACTALAVLCFLGYGHDGMTPTTHRAVVAKGLRWLVAQQRANGTFGERNYEHAIAVMALADAMGTTGGRWHPELGAAAQKGVDVLLARQNQSPSGKVGSGWDYTNPNPHRDDSSVTGWVIMALKSSAMAGLDIRNGFAGSKAWLENAWRAANPNAAKLTSRDVSVFPYTVDPTTGIIERDHLAGLGASCAAFLGYRRGEVLIESLANRIVANDLPQLSAWPCDTYLLYYDTMAMFQTTSDEKGSDPRWVAWSKPITDMLTVSQRRDEGCFDGSWDFQGTRFHGHETGRLLSTALCCLSLEVQERFAVATTRH